MSFVRVAIWLSLALVAFKACELAPAPVASLGLLAAPELQATAAPVPSLPASAVQREADSLRVASDAAARFCATSSAPAYMRTACGQLSRIRGRLATLLATATVPKPETVYVTTPAPGTPPAGNAGHIGYAVQLHYNAPAPYFPASGVDTVTICGVVDGPSTDAVNRRRLAWPPVRMRALGDSSSWTLRAGNPLTSMCAKAIAAAGLTRTDSIPVQWSGHWVTIAGRRLYRPFPDVP